MLLFQDRDGPTLARVKIQLVAEELAALPDDRVVHADENELVEFFKRKHHIEYPVDRYEDAVIEKTTRDMRVRDYGAQQDIRGVVCKFEVPFCGDEQIFSMSAHAGDSKPPEAQLSENKLCFEVAAPSLSSDQIADSFERWKRSIEKYLRWHRTLWMELDDNVEKAARSGIAIRLKKINALHDSASEAAKKLGIKLKTNENDPKTFVAPPVRQKIAPSLPPTKPTGRPTPADPTLARDIYESIIDILRGAGRSIERSASSIRQHDEEVLRDILLIPLNSHFEGAAHGEAFNKVGKTDIVLRHEKDNLFVAECKIWSGSKAIGEAVDQLLGYLTWRDSKSAIIIFNRNVKLSEILEKAVATVRAHMCFIKDRRKIDESSWEFVFRHPSDEQKQLALALLIFDMGAVAR